MIARNEADFGTPSQTVPILAAGKPFPPLNPSLTFDRELETATVVWVITDNNGAEIESNKVLVEEIEATCTA